MKATYIQPATIITNVAANKLICASFTESGDNYTTTIGGDQTDATSGNLGKHREEGFGDDPNGWTDGLW